LIHSTSFDHSIIPIFSSVLYYITIVLKYANLRVLSFTPQNHFSVHCGSPDSNPAHKCRQGEMWLRFSMPLDLWSNSRQIKRRRTHPAQNLH